VRADLQGAVEGGSSYSRTISGTLHGEWAVPDGGDCAGCGSARINVTFRRLSEYGTCLGDSDCAGLKPCSSYRCECSEDNCFCDE
jgi:hypothetical protein